MEKEFSIFANAFKHELMRAKALEYFIAIGEEYPEAKLDEQLKKMSLETISKLAQNAWLDEVDKLERMV